MQIPPFANQERLDGKTRVAISNRESLATENRVDAAEGVPRPRAIGAVDIVEFSVRLREIPEVRIDLVKEARRRVSSGYYRTREAAERTSAAILAT